MKILPESKNNLLNSAENLPSQLPPVRLAISVATFFMPWQFHWTERISIKRISAAMFWRLFAELVFPVAIDLWTITRLYSLDTTTAFPIPHARITLHPTLGSLSVHSGEKSYTHSGPSITPLYIGSSSFCATGSPCSHCGLPASCDSPKFDDSLCPYIVGNVRYSRVLLCCTVLYRYIYWRDFYVSVLEKYLSEWNWLFWKVLQKRL